MNILVTGGTGYIGSVVVKRLLEEGHQVIVFDNLRYGHKESVKCPVIVGDLINKEDLFTKLKDYKFDAIMHFAAYALAGESMSEPYKYFHYNIDGGVNLLEFAKSRSINNFIYSSSCSVYGSPKQVPVDENSPLNPVSIYGESKSILEKILKWYSKVSDIKYVILRYFNAAGASLEGGLGENHNPETHIIPLAIKAAITGRKFQIYGNDYDTEDGTCIRDYVHIEDLATAHTKALTRLCMTHNNNIYNIGSGKGYSNLEIINSIRKVTGLNLEIEYQPRRAGDPPIVYADIKKAETELGFKPKYSNLETIIETAYKWHVKLNKR